MFPNNTLESWTETPINQTVSDKKEQTATEPAAHEETQKRAPVHKTISTETDGHTEEIGQREKEHPPQLNHP